MSTALTGLAPDAARLLWPRTGRPPKDLAKGLDGADMAALGEALGRGYLVLSFRHPETRDRRPTAAYKVWRAYCQRHRQPLVYVRRYELVWWVDVILATDATMDEPRRYRECRRLDGAGYAQARKIALGAFAAWVEHPETVAECEESSPHPWQSCAPEVRPHYVSLSVPHGEADLVARTLLDLCQEHLEDAPAGEE
jgi:hypothetical protein